MEKKFLKTVYIEPGCISCGGCEALCPSVFKVDDVADVVEGADLIKHASMIKEAAGNCPVDVIKYEEEK
jgi:ferredoxin